MEETFHTKYEEFCYDLEATCPELKNDIDIAKNIPKENRIEAYNVNVIKVRKTTTTNDHTVLPGVTISNTLWDSLSSASHDAIRQYNNILDLTVMYHTGDVDGMSKETVDAMMKEWKTKMESIDFNKLSSKFFDIFGKEGGAFPPIPEKFLKGQMAKLAEDLVKEFDPSDFGFTIDDIESCEKNPARAFEILMRVSASNPNLIQNALQKIGKKLQQKVQSGQLRPQELAAEAEELIKEFQNNPAFVEILESFRTAFNFEDMEVARKSGNEGSGRLALVKQRLKKKLEAKKNKQV